MKTTPRTTSILVAGGVTLAVAIWMLSGLLAEDPANPATRSTVRSDDAAEGGNPERRPRVLVQRSSARTVRREILVSARTEPNRQVELRAETDGAVIALGIERGAKVETGQRIVSLDMRDRAARLEEAEALIVQMQLQYEAAERLRGQQFVSEAQIAEAKARLVGAEAAKQRILADIDYTTIEAPFDGVLQERSVEVGDYVQSGDIVAFLVDTDPMIVVGEVNEREVHSLAVGNPGAARLVDDTTVEGTIRYLAPVADENTRTFRVELAVPNPDGNFRAGMTAELRLSAEEITAHSLSASALALADDGTVGVKAVDENNRVRFYPVEIVSTSPEGISVTGLPRELGIISLGQGFVVEGQIVEAVSDREAMSQSDDARPY
ncbi:MAG TPA: efflux RND transporter periplasmic adaptor subunit [Gammaproteobacteria bacterium]|jgi:multidrug efflux system membrane fusion protein